MESQIKISDSASLCIIDIEGVIGLPEQSQFETPDARIATYEKFRHEVERISQIASPQVIVNIRSSGGDVNDALLIYEALVGLDAHITTRCYGYTASAATIIAQAASDGCREISSSALYLIHRSSCSTEGNAAELEAQVELLRKTDERLAAIYSARSGRESEQLVALMNENNGNGRWLSPDEAVEAGLVDCIIAPESGGSKGVVERVKGWLGIGHTKEEDRPTAPVVGHNVLHPIDGVQHSIIALSEGQSAVRPTTTSPVEDPSLDGSVLSPNAAAYNRDASLIRRTW